MQQEVAPLATLDLPACGGGTRIERPTLATLMDSASYDQENSTARRGKPFLA
jgi:hypothetical protein